MPELEIDVAAAFVHAIRHLAPAGDLFLGIDAGRVLVALALLRDLGGFADQETGGRALAVVVDRQRIGNEAGESAIAGQRRHHGAIGQCDGAEFVGLEKFGVAHVQAGSRWVGNAVQVDMSAAKRKLWPAMP